MNLYRQILNVALGFLALLSAPGAASGQSFYDVIISLSDRQRVISQQSQVGAYLRNENNDPAATDESIPADHPIDWQGVGTAPTQAAVEGLTIGGKITLLNQASLKFDELKSVFLNSSDAEYEEGSDVGTLQPYKMTDFDPLPRATPENFNELLRLCTQRVRALRLIAWPAAYRIRDFSDTTNVWEAVRYDENAEPYVQLMPEGTSSSSFTWKPGHIGPGNLTAAISEPWTNVNQSIASGLWVLGRYLEDDSAVEEITAPLRQQELSLQGSYPEEARISATAPGGAGAQIAGRVYVLRRSHWHQIDIEGASSKYEETQAGYVVEGSGSSGSIALFGSRPAATINGSWVTTREDDGNLTQKFVEGGYQDKEAAVLPESDPGFSNNYNNSYERNWNIGCTFYTVFKPTFTQGVDAPDMRSQLEATDAILADNAADGELLLHPRPNLLFGIRLGPGLKGAGNGYISGGSALEKGDYNGLFNYFDWGGGLWSWMPRFDSSYALQLAGSCADYHAVYENDRAGRTQSLPAGSLGWPYAPSPGSTSYNTDALYYSWDKPRLKQVAGRDLVADITYDSSHYGGYTVRIYRRSTGGATPQPGQVLDLSGMSLIRTWSFTHPEAGTTLHPTDAEKLQATGSGGEKFEIQANHIVPDQAFATGYWNHGYSHDWWWHQPGAWSWTLKLSQGTTEKLRKDLKITTTEDDSANFSWAVVLQEFLDGQLVSDLSSATLDPFSDRCPQDWEIKSAGKTLTGAAFFSPSAAGSGNGKWPTAVAITYDGIQPDAQSTWSADGLLAASSQGQWSATGVIDDGAYKLTQTFNSAPYATTWTELLDGGNKIKTYSAPDGNAGSKSHAAVAWAEVEYGNAANGLPGLPRIVKSSDGTGATYGWSAGGDGSYILTLEQGKLSGSTVSGGFKVISDINAHGQPNKLEFYLTNGGSLQASGTVFSNFTEWGMPRKSTDFSTRLDSTWDFSSNLSRLSAHTSALGVASAVSSYDVLGRPTAFSHNGISAANTYTAFSTTSTITGAATGTLAATRDALGRLTSSNTSWNGVPDNLGLTYGTGGMVAISRTAGPYGTHNATVRQDDGSVSSASGPTLAFGGTAGDALSVSNGLLVSRTAITDAPGTYQETHTDAWGRVRKVVTPSNSGAPQTETTIIYSDPDSTLQRVITVEPSGRVLITESNPYDASGAISRSGIDLNFDPQHPENASLGGTDRYTESVTTIQGTTTAVTTLKVTENTGLREILRTEWTPATGITITTANGGEQTITRDPKYTAKTIKTQAKHGTTDLWTKTESFNNLGLTTNSELSGTGIPTTGLAPVWRADGSLASVSLTIGSETHSAAFNPNGTLASLKVPADPVVFPTGRNILEEHTIDGDVETLTVEGATVTRKLDGTQVATSGADIIGKTDTLAVSASGYQQTTHPAIGADTTIAFNCAGTPTAKSYAAGAGESYGYEGELLTSVTLARGGWLSIGYSDDGAKDLISAAWPTMVSGIEPNTIDIPAVAHTFGYDRAGRVDEIGDASGSRTLGYQNGRPASELWTAGPLKGYQLINTYDNGRETGFILKRDGAVVHSAEKAPNGISDQISALASGTLKVVPQRDGAGRITGFQWGNATGTFIPAVTQTWQRGVRGRIEAAESDVSGATSFDYLIDPNNTGQSFDTRGRRLKCATAGGTWSYQYGIAGQLTNATHPTLGTFSYQFDGIGRRTDKGSSNTSDLLNRTLAWTNSQNKTVKVVAHPDARVWFNGTEVPNFTGSYNHPITPPGPQGGWVPWKALAVLEGQGEGAGNPPINPLASPDAKSQQIGAVWVPPVDETFTYDAAGNRESSAQWDYGWDAKNQLIRARSKACNTATTPQGCDITNAYDAEGRRFSKKVTRYQNGSIVEKKVITFLHDGDDIIYERQQLESGLTTCERKYVWGPDISGTQGGAGGAGGLLLIRETKGNSTIDLYPLYDGTGHVVALATMIAGTATLVAEYAYGPFGESIYARGPHAQSCPFRYATKYYDQEAGLYDFGKRYLDPITGQWLSRDPMGESEGPNLFSYCLNDPINYVDFEGLWPINTQEAANDQRVEWLLMQLSAGGGLPYAPPDQFKLYFPESGNFGLYTPYGQEDYKRAQTFVQNLGRPSMRPMTAEQAASASQPSFGPAPEWIPSTTSALTIGAANTSLNASINSDWLLPTGAGAAGTKFLFGGMKAMLPILAAGARTEGKLLTAEMRTGEILSNFSPNIIGAKTWQQYERGVREIYGNVPFAQRQYQSIVDGTLVNGIADNIAMIGGKNVAIEAKFVTEAWSNSLRNPRSGIGAMQFSKVERRKMVNQAKAYSATFEEVFYHTNDVHLMNHYSRVFEKFGLDNVRFIHTP